MHRSFGESHVTFPVLERLQNELLARAWAWQATRELRVCEQLWLRFAVSMLTAHEMSARLDALRAALDRAGRLSEAVRLSPLASASGAVLEKLASFVPALRLLRTPQLQPRHRAAIAQLLGAGAPVDWDSVSMDQLLPAGLLQQQAAIACIAERAQREAVMEAQLRQATRRWENAYVRRRRDAH